MMELIENTSKTWKYGLAVDLHGGGKVVMSLCVFLYT